MFPADAVFCNTEAEIPNVSDSSSSAQFLNMSQFMLAELYLSLFGIKFDFTDSSRFPFPQSHTSITGDLTGNIEPVRRIHACGSLLDSDFWG